MRLQSKVKYKALSDATIRSMSKAQVVERLRTVERLYSASNELYEKERVRTIDECIQLISHCRLSEDITLVAMMVYALENMKEGG